MTFETIPDLLAELLAEQRRNTEAIIGLAEALAGIRAKAATTVKAAKEQAPEPEQTPAPKPAAAAPTAPAPAPSAPAATTVVSPSEPAIAVAEVNAAIIGLAKARGRDTAVAVLQQFGVVKVPELKPEQYADVIAAAQKAMG